MNRAERRSTTRFFQTKARCRTGWILTAAAFLLCAGCAVPRTVRRGPPPQEAEDYVSLVRFCRDEGYRREYDTLDDLVMLTSKEKTVRMLIDSAVGYVNGRIVSFDRPVRYSAQGIMVPRRLGEILASQEAAFRPAFRLQRIILDAGHGGKDPGAISPHGLQEKEVNLRVTRFLQKELQDRGFEVVLTRSRDAYLTLQERVEIAHAQKGDMFLSIHANSNRSSRVSGLEIYSLSPGRFQPETRAAKLARQAAFFGAPQDVRVILWDMLLVKNHILSVECANTLYGTMKDLGFPVKPVRRAPFYVLRFAYVPSVLVEIGYLSNHREEKILRREYYQRQVAEAIAVALVNLKRQFAPERREVQAR
ncbi:MAG: hypothetical protein GF333_06560 [Candidatus Omnitrophica bacterium]|nr:hypothetical protein [Candidatus Omnitrophota bacterium]